MNRQDRDEKRCSENLEKPHDCGDVVPGAVQVPTVLQTVDSKDDTVTALHLSTPRAAPDDTATQLHRDNGYGWRPPKLSKIGLPIPRNNRFTRWTLAFIVGFATGSHRPVRACR